MPGLTARRPDGEAWHRATRRWWRSWKESPQSPIFTASDWQFLYDTALLYDHYVRGQLRLATEIRQRVAKLGATQEDRIRLRWTVEVQEAQPEPVQPQSPERYRRLLELTERSA